MTVHRLYIIDRGTHHVHRFRPICACGLWAGANRRRKREAVKQYRSHRAFFAVRPSNGTWRRPTPSDQLPEALLVMEGQ